MTFVVVRHDGDVTLGFEGSPWHTHGDLISALTELAIEEAVGSFVDALLDNRTIVAVTTVEGVVRDIWIADLPIGPDPYKPENESNAFRLWDGTPCGIDWSPPKPPAR